MKTSAILIGVKAQFKADDPALGTTSPYLCDHIREYCNDDYDMFHKGIALCNMIDKRINGAFSVKQWLISQGVPQVDLTPSALREYRLRWLDQLISEFKAKKD